MLEIKYIKYTLQFKKAAGTSRGFLKTKDSWFFKAQNQITKAISYGECGILKGLSIDPQDGYEWVLQQVCSHPISFESFEILDLYPSIKFGLEMLNKGIASPGTFHLFDNPFSNGQQSIPINGLIWMASRQEMKDQIIDKIKNGFTCIKIKIGAIDLEEEIALLKFIRNEYSKNDIIIRLDANGAFDYKQAVVFLDRISKLGIHSIEQPIASGQLENMANLIHKSPVKIALDEELIPIRDRSLREKILKTLKPHYIILKPSLLGGFKDCDEWIELADQNNIGWWVTSALESNIGLNAIAQYTASKSNPLHQGLGTGSLYSNNFDSPLSIENGGLHYDPEKEWKIHI